MLGSSHVIIWDGIYPNESIINVVSTVVGTNFSSVVSDNIYSLNKRNQVVWDIPCDFNISESWYKLIFVDKNTNRTMAEGPVFGIGKQKVAFCIESL